MSRPIPLVRAAALAPFLLWMRDHGLSWQERLRKAGLPGSLLFEPERPIALLAGVRFLAQTSRTEGPDIGCRVVVDTSMAQLASFGRIALGSRRPRDALGNVMRAYPHHSSHEHLVLVDQSDRVVVRHRFLVDLDDVSLHVCHQYIGALVRAMAAGTGWTGARLAGVQITPHPVSGLGHLRGLFDGPVTAATDRTLTITLDPAVLDRPYLRQSRDRRQLGLSSIRGDGTLTHSLRQVLPGCLENGSVQMAEIAALAGISSRTLQRRLAAENTSLSQEIDRLRCEQARHRLAGSSEKVGDISADLGYSDQSSLSRAMRRWSDMTPSGYRQG